MGEKRPSSGKPKPRPADRQGRTAAGDIPRPDAYGQRPWSEEAVKAGKAPYESRQPSPPPGTEDAGHGYTQDSGYPQSEGYHGPDGAAAPYAPEGGFGSAEADVEPPPARRASQPEPTHADAQLHDDVRAQLEREQLDPRQITVRVEDGAVMLEGHVPTAHERMRAQEIAEGVRGVLRVENRLRTDAS